MCGICRLIVPTERPLFFLKSALLSKNQSSPRGNHWLKYESERKETEEAEQ